MSDITMRLDGDCSGHPRDQSQNPGTSAEQEQPSAGPLDVFATRSEFIYLLGLVKTLVTLLLAELSDATVKPALEQEEQFSAQKTIQSAAPWAQQQNQRQGPYSNQSPSLVTPGPITRQKAKKE